MLLLASDSAFVSEVREALEMQQRGREPPLFFQLVYLDPTQCDDFLAALDLLNYIRQGVFDPQLPGPVLDILTFKVNTLYVHGKLLSVSRRSTRQNTKKFIKQTPFSRVSLGVLSKRSVALLKLLD